MTIYEAIKSGRSCRRRSWPLGAYLNPDRNDFNLTTEDLSADDWEVKEVVIIISDSDFERARERVNKRLYTSPHSEVHISEYLKELKKELGL
jgi:hypothetical protein